MITDAGSRGKIPGFNPPALISMGLETRPGCSHGGEAAGRRSVAIGPACRPRWGHGALAAATALHAVHDMGWVGAAGKPRRGSGLMEWAAKERGGMMMQGLVGTPTSRSVARSSTAAGMDANGEDEGGGGGEVYERSMSPVERARMQEEEEPMGICGKVLRGQVEVLSSSLWKIGWRSFWLQLALSALSLCTLWLSLMMQRTAFEAAAAGWPRVAALRGALGEGLVACGASLGISAVHMLWSLSYVRAGSRALSAAQRSDVDGLGPLFERFAGVRRSLARGCGLGIVGSAVACFGAQQVLGNMVIRMLLVRGFSIDFWITNPPARLQALDLFAMQSGFFALGSHLAGLIHSHILRSRVPEA